MKYRGPIYRGPICRTQIFQGPNLPGTIRQKTANWTPKSAGPNLPANWQFAQNSPCNYPPLTLASPCSVE